ncbi:hypothetical protein GGR57DRAFT_440412 [Xylariaceae sp. FL1272]|nr:hypothetical protein GGR57DRAFT_440412 [Xylariaceae sp. FL1272]
MGLFAKTRRRSQSYGAGVISPYWNDEDSELFLPGDDGVFLTKTKLGEPALGRRKSNKLMNNAHFDLLAESVGVPSRATFVDKSRPASSISQSSGVLTPVRSHGAKKDEQRRRGTCITHSKRDTGSLVFDAEIEAREASAEPIAEHMSHEHNQGLALGGTRVIPCGYSNLPFPSNDSKPLPPVAIPWNQHPMTRTSTGFTAPTYSFMDAGFSPLFNYCYPMTTAPPFPPTFMATQHATVGPSPIVPGIPQSLSAPGITQTHDRQTNTPIPLYHPVMQSMPISYAVTVPAAPPPPTEWVRSSAVPVDPRMVPGPSKGECKSKHIDKVAGSATRSEHPTLDTRLLDSRSRQDPRVGDQVRHHHICRGCGKKRSRYYHETHPLRRGEVPPPAYCARCRREAAETLRFYSESSSGNNTDWSQGPEIMSTAHASHSLGGERGQVSRWRKPRWSGRSQAFASISRLFSRKVNSHSHNHSRSPYPAGKSGRVRPHIRVPSDSTPYVDIGVSDSACPVSRSAHNNSGDVASMKEAPQVTSCSPLVPRKQESIKPQEIYSTFPAKGPSRGSKRTTLRRRARIPTRQKEPTTISPLECTLLRGDDQPCINSSSHEVNYSQSAERETRRGKIQYAPPVVSTVESEDTISKVHTSHAELRARKSAEMPVSPFTKPTDESRSPEHRYAKQDRRYHQHRRVSPSTSRIVTERNEDKAEPLLSHHTKPVLFHEVGSHTGPKPNDTLDEHTNGHVLDQPFRSPPEMPKSTRNSDWDEPATPKDDEWNFTAVFPCSVHDSWSQDQSNLEQTAEEMAQHELASAGKFFGGFEQFLHPSSSTFHPVISPVLRSNLSIMSCESDAESDPNMAASPIAYDSETEGPNSSTGEENIVAKQIDG